MSAQLAVVAWVDALGLRDERLVHRQPQVDPLLVAQVGRLHVHLLEEDLGVLDGHHEPGLVPHRDGQHRRLVEGLVVRVRLQVHDDVLLRVLEGDDGVLLGPHALEARVLGRGLGAVPALLVDEEDVLRLREQLHLAHRVLAQARVLALERHALAAGHRLQAHAHVHVPHVGVDGNELGPRVGVGLARLPLGDGRDRDVVVVEEQHFVRVQEVHEGAVVLVELLRRRLHLPGVGHLDRAAQRRARPIELDLRDDVVDLRGLPAATGREQGERRERHHGRRAPGTSTVHLSLLVIYCKM